MEHENLRRHELGNHIILYTDRVHRFGTDAVLLADFAAPAPQEKTVEFGTGCGIISLIWCRKEKPDRIDALELQEDAVDLVKMAIEANGLSQRLRVIQGDLTRVEQLLPKGYYDLAVMNPPYKRADDGVITPIPGLAVARHEIKCSLKEICRAAAIVLNTGGRFCMCHRPARLAEVLCAMHDASLEPKRIRFIQQRTGSVPNLFLIEGKKGASAGMTVEAPLILETENGAMTDQAIGAYGAYYEQKGSRP